MNDVSLFTQRLIKEIEKSGKSVNRIERELGYTRNALNNYKNGALPSGIRLVELAKYFKVSPEYLIGKETTGVFYPPAPIEMFNSLDDNQKIELLKIAQIWAYKKLKNK